MSEEKPFKLPLGILTLDLVGVVLAGLGFAKMYTGIDILPAAFQFDDSGWTLMIVGGLMMLPFMFFTLSKIRERVEQNTIK